MIIKERDRRKLARKKERRATLILGKINFHMRHWQVPDPHNSIGRSRTDTIHAWGIRPYSHRQFPYKRGTHLICGTGTAILAVLYRYSTHLIFWYRHDHYIKSYIKF